MGGIGSGLNKATVAVVEKPYRGDEIVRAIWATLRNQSQRSD